MTTTPGLDEGPAWQMTVAELQEALMVLMPETWALVAEALVAAALAIGEEGAAREAPRRGDAVVRDQLVIAKTLIEELLIEVEKLVSKHGGSNEADAG